MRHRDHVPSSYCIAVTIKGWLSRLHIFFGTEADKGTLPMFCNRSVMLNIKLWFTELMVEVVATFILGKIRSYVPALFVTWPDNQWKFLGCFKKMCQFRIISFMFINLVSPLKIGWNRSQNSTNQFVGKFIWLLIICLWFESMTLWPFYRLHKCKENPPSIKITP